MFWVWFSFTKRHSTFYIAILCWKCTLNLMTWHNHISYHDILRIYISPHLWSSKIDSKVHNTCCHAPCCLVLSLVVFEWKSVNFQHFRVRRMSYKVTKELLVDSMFWERAQNIISELSLFPECDRSWSFWLVPCSGNVLRIYFLMISGVLRMCESAWWSLVPFFWSIFCGNLVENAWISKHGVVCFDGSKLKRW